MKRFNLKKYSIGLMLMIVALGFGSLFSSCGSTRSYWGVENEYVWGDDYHHHHHKPKHKKHKKRKKHKKHHHHHHDDD